jgi:ABC-type glycerol-3-phosphate transport system substrate-binding protein
MTGKISRRNFLKSAAVVGAGAIALAACAPKATEEPAVEEPAVEEPAGEPAAASGEIRMLTLQGPPVEPVQELIIPVFNEKYPGVKVKIEYDGAGDAAKYATAAAAGTMADVFFSADLWVVPFAKQGVSLDLKPFTDADPEINLDDIFPSMLGLGTFDNQIHMLPSALDVVTMYYNKTMLEKAGAQLPTTEWTWDDLITNFKLVTEMEKDENGNPMNWGLSHASSGVWSWWPAYYSWVVGYGGKILENGKSTWSDPKTIEGIRGYTELWTKHNIAQPLGNDVGGEAFRMGRAAAYTHIPGVRTDVRTTVADKFEWDVQVMPKMPDGKHRTGMGAWGLSAYSGSKNQQWAYDYAKLLVSPEIQRTMAEKEMGTPLVKSVAQDPSWREGLPTPPNNLDAFFMGAEDAILPVMDYPADCGSFYAGKVNEAITAALEKIIRGESSVEDALAEIDATVQVCLDENQ